MEIAKKLSKAFDEKDIIKLHEFLQKQGMFKSGNRALDQVKKLEKLDAWSTVEELNRKYSKLWDGPDVPIYIFPIQQGNLFSRGYSKSGIAFKDKMLLFLSPYLENEELEALFVHEYHHICRINAQKKTTLDFTLLDSMIMEGLAEYTVKDRVGEKNLARWTKMYSENQLLAYWKKYIQDDLQSTRKDKQHDSIMFGATGIPRMLGYCFGFYLVEKFYKNKHFSSKASFTIPSLKFLEEFLSEQ
ncbi:DUF2268 domain-containing protein [Peribacillus tepidiphilus]|uniref:DUF2268 domain-containing protein n=1 Tax=Peribacillus tepidiphilus TaxID=2652445 RepID=UPI0035B521D5